MSGAFRQAITHGPDCPPLDELLSFSGKFSAHVNTCSACQTELALLQRFNAPPETSEERAAVTAIAGRLKPPRPGSLPAEPRRRWWSVLHPALNPAWLGGAALAAASLIFSVAITSQWRSSQPRPAPPPETEQMRSRALRITSPHGDLQTLLREITWEPVSGAVSYAVTITEVDKSVLIYKKVTSPSLVLPDPLYMLVTSGKTVLVNVSALNSSEAEISGSGAVTLHVLPQSTPSLPK